ncbi:hypothetical protein FA13DRAFT_1479524 [Coprinellus micaceus]|uniref:Uncharacterized protein n=1 Tax=Coprinellus micaceus TaxID=71717 RepID=A0A4Y7SL67_COPMI|nr:hypothetical protein FA13DRAFT_1479524 [Coprinellus micaceus]
MGFREGKSEPGRVEPGQKKRKSEHSLQHRNRGGGCKMRSPNVEADDRTRLVGARLPSRSSCEMRPHRFYCPPTQRTATTPRKRGYLPRLGERLPQRINPSRGVGLGQVCTTLGNTASTRNMAGRGSVAEARSTWPRDREYDPSQSLGAIQKMG